MPTETAIILAGIILLFVVFALALVGADCYTRNLHAPDANG